MNNFDYGTNPEAFYGKKIIGVKTEEREIKLFFDDNTLIEITDEPDCCADKYFTYDDDLQELVGNTLTKIEAVWNHDVEDDWGGSHEHGFLKFFTDKNQLSVCTHNEHNGYYGGISIKIEEVKL